MTAAGSVRAYPCTRAGADDDHAALDVTRLPHATASSGARGSRRAAPPAAGPKTYTVRSSLCEVPGAADALEGGGGCRTSARRCAPPRRAASSPPAGGRGSTRRPEARKARQPRAQLALAPLPSTCAPSRRVAADGEVTTEAGAEGADAAARTGSSRASFWPAERVNVGGCAASAVPPPSTRATLEPKSRACVKVIVGEKSALYLAHIRPRLPGARSRNRASRSRTIEREQHRVEQRRRHQRLVDTLRPPDPQGDRPAPYLDHDGDAPIDARVREAMAPARSPGERREHDALSARARARGRGGRAS